MKKVSFICNKCGKAIKADELYQLWINKLDSNNGKDIIDKPEHIVDLAYNDLADKHFCEKCLINIVKSLPGEPDEVPKVEAVTPAEVEAAAPIEEIESVTADEQEPVEPKEQDTDITEAELRKLLIDEHLSINEVADRYNCSYNRIWKRATKWGIIAKKDRKPKEQAEVKEEPEPEPEDEAGEDTEPTEEEPKPEQKPEPEPAVSKNCTPAMTVESVKEDYYIKKLTVPDMAKKYGVVISIMRSFMIKHRIGMNTKEYKNYMRQHGRTEFE